MKKEEIEYIKDLYLNQLLSIGEISELTHHKHGTIKKYLLMNNVELRTPQEQYKMTCLKKYGVENPMQDADIKQRLRESMQETYGVSHALQRKEFLEKSKNTCIEKYGVDNYRKTEECSQKVEKTNFQRYGCKAPCQNPVIQEKRRNTCIEKYGVDNYVKTQEYQEKANRHHYIFSDIHFDSSWELYYFIWCKDHNIDIKRNYTGLPYYYKDIEHFYFPDFILNGRYIEIKGSQFFNEEGSFINPYKKDMESQNLYSAKYECMMNNNVIIIPLFKISSIIKEVKSKYGADYIKQFKKHI